jgi:hypothetical protein
MKNNLILDVQGLKKMLKGMFLVVGLFMVVVVDARVGGSQKPQAQQQPAQQPIQTQQPLQQQGQQSQTRQQMQQTQQQVTTTAQQKAMPANLSPLAQVGWEEHGTKSKKLDSFVQKNKSRLTARDIKELEARVAELRETEVMLAKDQEVTALRKTVKRLTNLLEKMQSGQMVTQARAVPATEQQGWGVTLKSYAIMPIAGMAYALSNMASWATRRDMTDAELIAHFSDLWEQQLNDQGKYPTYESRIMAINEDVINTGADGLTDVIHDGIRAELRKRLNEKSAKYFEKNSKDKEKAINAEIASVRDTYNRDEDNLEKYLNELSTVNMSKMGINRCRAMVSEFLRTQDVLKLKKDAATIAASKKVTAEPAATTEQVVKPAPTETPLWRRILLREE